MRKLARENQNILNYPVTQFQLKQQKRENWFEFIFFKRAFGIIEM